MVSTLQDRSCNLAGTTETGWKTALADAIAAAVSRNQRCSNDRQGLPREREWTTAARSRLQSRLPSLSRRSSFPIDWAGFWGGRSRHRGGTARHLSSGL